MTKRKAPEDKLKVGRPTKYYPDLCEEVIAFCADGYSMAAFAGHIGVSYSTVKLWEEEHPEFSAATNIARAKAVLWWEGENRRVVQKGGGPGTAQLISLGLRNRAPEEWREKIDVNANHAGSIVLKVSADDADL